MSGAIFTAFFLGMIAGMFLVALTLFVYGLVTRHRAYKKNEQELANGLRAIREEYRPQ